MMDDRSTTLKFFLFARRTTRNSMVVGILSGESGGTRCGLRTAWLSFRCNPLEPDTVSHARRHFYILDSSM